MQLIQLNSRTELTDLFARGLIVKDAHYVINNVGIVYKPSPGRDGFISVANGFSKAFPGDVLFQMRATHGLPLGDALAEIKKEGFPVTWVDFIVEARKNGWWDFQTLEAIEQAFVDCDWEKHSAGQIIHRLKHWIMENPLEQSH